LPPSGAAEVLIDSLPKLQLKSIVPIEFRSSARFFLSNRLIRGNLLNWLLLWHSNTSRLGERRFFLRTISFASSVGLPVDTGQRVSLQTKKGTNSL